MNDPMPTLQTQTPNSTPVLTSTATMTPPPSVQLSQQPPSKNRCACCSKKLVLSDFACGKCQTRYCATHRLPESHACTHDFRATGKEQLTQQLTRVVADKIQHI